MVLEKTLESPLDCKEIQPVHSEDQLWDFFERNDAKVETPVLWPPHAIAYETFSRTDLMLGHQTSLDKFKRQKLYKIHFLTIIWFKKRLEIIYRKEFGEFISMWKLNNTILNSQWVKEET